MDPLIIPIVGIALPVVLVPTIMTLKHRQSRQEWEHLERMKAMELGHRMPPADVAGATKSIAWIGAGVPIFAVCAALLTCLEGPDLVDGVPLAAIAWGCAALISGSALVTSLVVAFLIGRPRKPMDSVHGMSNGKPVVDRDAFEMVGS